MVPSTEIRGSKKSVRPSSTREGVIGNSGVAISLGNGCKLLRASLRRSASTSAARAAAWLVSKAPIASTNATPVSAMPAASAASVCNFIIAQTPGLIFLRSAYEAGGGAHRLPRNWHEIDRSGSPDRDGDRHIEIASDRIRVRADRMSTLGID